MDETMQDTKRVYNYDRDTKRYTTTSILDETDKTEDGVWILPANCTELPPLTVKDGFVSKFNVVSNTWEYEEVLSELKVEKLKAIDRWTEKQIIGGFTSNCTGETVRYDSDKDTQLTMQGIGLNVDSPLFTERYPNGCPVRGYPLNENEKKIYMLNSQQVMTWLADLSTHIGTCKQKGWEKQEKVNKATSKADLDLIELS